MAPSTTPARAPASTPPRAGGASRPCLQPDTRDQRRSGRPVAAQNEIATAAGLFRFSHVPDQPFAESRPRTRTDPAHRAGWPAPARRCRRRPGAPDAQVAGVGIRVTSQVPVAPSGSRPRDRKRRVWPAPRAPGDPSHEHRVACRRAGKGVPQSVADQGASCRPDSAPFSVRSPESRPACTDTWPAIHQPGHRQRDHDLDQREGAAHLPAPRRGAPP